MMRIVRSEYPMSDDELEDYCEEENTYSYRVFDFKQCDIKRNYREQKMRVENWILHKHSYRA